MDFLNHLNTLLLREVYSLSLCPSTAIKERKKKMKPETTNYLRALAAFSEDATRLTLFINQKIAPVKTDQQEVLDHLKNACASFDERLKLIGVDEDYKEHSCTLLGALSNELFEQYNDYQYRLTNPKPHTAVSKEGHLTYHLRTEAVLQSVSQIATANTFETISSLNKS